MAFISEAYFKENAWRLSQAGGLLLAPAFRFRDHGIVGGFMSPWERIWELRGSSIALQDISGVTTTCLEIQDQDERGVKEMRGRSRVAPQIEHVLTRVDMPSLAENPFGSEDASSIGVVKNNKKGKRRNLVVLRANNRSLHRQWPRYLADEDRNWDLCISWYGSDVPDFFEESEYFFHQPNHMKFFAISNLLTYQPNLLEYDNFWFPDDDLETSWRDINRLFNIFRRSALELAQPALSNNSNSYINHQVTAHVPDHYLRFCDFIELMCPMLSRNLLEICLPAFRGTTWAYCMDHVWGGLQGRVPGRTAIIDDVVVAHSRPMGMNYDSGEAMAEGNRLAGMYGIHGSYAVHGGIRRDTCML